MYIFTINATDAFGNKKALKIQAKTPQEALAKLKEEGYRAAMADIIAGEKATWFAKLKNLDIAGHFSSVSQADILRLIKMIGNSLNRGRSIKTTLEFIGENEDSQALKRVIMRLRDRMEKPFTSQIEIFDTFPQYFDEEFLGIIKAGETAANLGEYLIDYVEEKKKQILLVAKFKNVMLSRLLTLLMVIAVAIVVVIFVIPQFKQLFGEKMAIPWAMATLLGISNFFKAFGIVIVLFLTLLIASLVYLIKNNPQVRWWWHDFLLFIPVFGTTLRTFYTAQFAYLLSTLLTKSVDIVTAMNIIIRQAGNVCLKKTYTNIIKSMQSGDDLFTAIIKEEQGGRSYMVPAIVQAAKVGGATSSLGATLLDVRHDLDDLFVIRLERAIKGFSIGFYALILGFGLFIAYAIGTAIIAFYENAQNLI